MHMLYLSHIYGLYISNSGVSLWSNNIKQIINLYRSYSIYEPLKVPAESQILEDPSGKQIMHNHHNMNYLVMLWIIHGVSCWEFWVSMMIQVFVVANAWLRKIWKHGNTLTHVPCSIVLLCLSKHSQGWLRGLVGRYQDLLLCYKALCWWSYGNTT